MNLLIIFLISLTNCEDSLTMIANKSEYIWAKQTLEQYVSAIHLRSWNLFDKILRGDFKSEQCDGTTFDRRYLGDRVTKSSIELKYRSRSFIDHKISGELMRIKVNVSAYSINTYEAIFDEKLNTFLISYEKMEQCRGPVFLTTLINDNQFMQDSVYNLISLYHEGIRTKDVLSFESAITRDFSLTSCLDDSEMNSDTILALIGNLYTPIRLNHNKINESSINYDVHEGEMIFTEHQTVAIYKYTARFDEKNHNFRLSRAEPVTCFDKINMIPLINRQIVGLEIAEKIVRILNGTIELNSFKRLGYLIKKPVEIIDCDGKRDSITIDDYFEQLISKTIHRIDENAENTIKVENDFEIDNQQIIFVFQNNQFSKKRIDAQIKNRVISIQSETRLICGDNKLYANLWERRRNAKLMEISENLLEGYRNAIQQKWGFYEYVSDSFEIRWIDRNNTRRERKWLVSDSFEKGFSSDWQKLMVYSVVQNDDKTIRFIARAGRIENEYETIIINDRHFINYEYRKTQ